jgi:hypothetical protein
MQAVTLQTTLQNGITISDLPGPTGGIMLKSASGATLIVNDTGIYIQNGKGADDHAGGPDRDHQQRRPDGGLRERTHHARAISSTSAPRCSVPTAARPRPPRRTRACCWAASPA